MKFAYTYRSSDGQRHTAEIEAESRDAAFAAIRRELGVKPIRVTVAGGQDSAERAPAHGGGWGKVAVAVLCAVVLGGAWWWLAGRSAPYQVMTPQGPVTYTIATPLARQMIPGDRRRIEEAMAARTEDAPGSGGVFRHAAESWLARYAEPGRPGGQAARAEDAPGRPSAADFEAALREPIRIASSDFTEVVDLKRIVAGMKREMQAYLVGGGTAEQYLAELEKRQRLEVSYRENAERRLAELVAAVLEGGKGAARTRAAAPDALREAYEFWLKANAQLQSMGIWPLPLPDALRAYQMGLDIDQ